MLSERLTKHHVPYCVTVFFVCVCVCECVFFFFAKPPRKTIRIGSYAGTKCVAYRVLHLSVPFFFFVIMEDRDS